MKIADSHTHLNQISESTQEIINNSPEVKIFITIGTILEDDFSQFTAFDSVYCTYGIHPNDYLKEDSKTIEYVNEDSKRQYLYNTLKEKIRKEPKCVGIGETGLDFFYGKEEKVQKIQYELLHLQLQLAKELDKVVCIHGRGCDIKEIVDIIKFYKLKFVLHCYTYDIKNAMYAIENNGYISFSGVLTFGKNVEALEETAIHLPEGRIMIETDAPYLAPTPFRGKPNHPKYLKYTLEKLSLLRKEDIQKTAEYTFKNTLEFYNIKE